ncbi:MAG: hypothetical protein LBQ30_03035 [Treponema sp.]|jgi:hypothetical protein|nr:hypothetical protein [Treponema sp.]
MQGSGEGAATPAIELKQQFYNSKQAWELKGGCSWNTFKNIRYFQPKGGHYDGYFGGRGIFFRETVAEWLPLVDADLPEYHKKYKTGAKPQNRIKNIQPLEAVGDDPWGARSAVKRSV